MTKQTGALTLCIFMTAGILHAQKASQSDGQWVPSRAQTHGVIQKKDEKKTYPASAALFSGKELVNQDFGNVVYGQIPAGWTDLSFRRPSRNWLVDGKGFLRHVLKNRNNRLSYDPFSDGFLETPTTANRPGLITWGPNESEKQPPRIPLRVQATFKKTEDEAVFFGIAGRVTDKRNFYAVLVEGNDKLRIVKSKNDTIITLTEIVSLRKYRHPEVWALAAAFNDDLITGILYDADGQEVARIDARDAEFDATRFGFYCTDYAAAASVSATVPEDVWPTYSDASRTADQPPVYSSYPLIRPVENPETLTTAFEHIQNQYDIIIAGAGTGGWAAAIQAARMGRQVLLLEETDWIGGQMAAAAVTSMDESGPLVRERGIYRQFHESMVAHYYSQDKCPFMAYYWGRNTQNQQEGGYEPLVARNMLYGFIADARKQAAEVAPQGRLDLLLRTKVTAVSKKGNTITGVTVSQWNEHDQNQEKRLTCKILVDATEYGDVIPLTGAPYRVGNTKSGDRNYAGAVQDHTYTAVIREYPGGIPEHLRLNVPPPDYDKYSKNFRSRILSGDWELHKGARMFRAELAWRGMADSHSSLTGKSSQLRHTLTGLNGGNDYPTSVGTIEREEQRIADERDGINRTLSKIYYLQNELGVPWSVAEEQGFNTAYNRYMMEKRGVDKALLPIAMHLPQLPYVRESRRIEGIQILVADDLQRWENAKHQPTSIAVGDYYMDLHRTDEHYEKDLDQEEYDMSGGPFQVPFEVFIPLKLDGFLPAEKNFSQSRLVNGATRLQPITMLTGQAVGTIAAIAVDKGVQPRKLNPMEVQLTLLDNGVTLVPRWYTDVEWNTELWKATQLLSLYQLLDSKGELEYWDGMEFAAKTAWESNQTLSKGTIKSALDKLGTLLKISTGELLKHSNWLDHEDITKKQFALFCLETVRNHLN